MRFSSPILDDMETCSAQFDFIHGAGFHEDVGHKLVSETIAQRIQAECIEHIQKVPPADSSREWDLWRVLDAVQAETGKPLLTTSADSVPLKTALFFLRSTARSQSMDFPQARTEYLLSYGSLAPTLS